MKIAGTEYNLNHKALEIYLSGCKAPHCPSCHNTELWDFNVGRNASGEAFNEILRKTQEPMVERVFIMGGEPLDQDQKQLFNFLHYMYCWGGQSEIWLWTRYPETDVTDMMRIPLTHIKSGAYQKDLPGYTDEEYGITLASSNQKIIKL